MIKSRDAFCNLIPFLRIAFSTSKFGDQHLFTTQAVSSLQQANSSRVHREAGHDCDEGRPDVDWDRLGFDHVVTDHMYVMKCSKDERFAEGQITRYGNIELSPAAGVLNYGQALFEGMKTIRREDGHVVLFRPEQNAIRMQMGAERMCMPSPSVDQFIDAVKQTALANKRWIPPHGKGSLYIRPLLMGTGPVLRLVASPDYTFLVYASPIRSYFKENSALNLLVEDEFERASPGGTGGVKSVTNYGPALRPLTSAKKRGFSDILYLDSVSRKYVEEASCCNIFIVKDGTLSTPAINGAILPGVTRNSIIEIACDHGHKVEERPILVEELIDADEVFCTANAFGVAPVSSVTYQDRRVEYETGSDRVWKHLLSTFTGIQNGLVEDRKGWIVQIS